MSGRPPAAEELGPEVAYLGLKEGTPVYDPEGKRVGVVEEVLAGAGFFEGLLIHTVPLPGRHLVARPEQVAELRERGVVLSVGRDALEDGEGRRHGDGPDTRLEHPVEAWLRRLWDRITGRR